MNNQSEPQSQNNDCNLFKTVIPWDDQVDGDTLLSEIKLFVKRYVACEDHTATAATIWIAFTWFTDSVTIAPIANITAPLPNCGKSTLLDLMELLVKKPIKVDNVSPAALYRTIEKWQPTLLIDEVDAFLKGNEDARGILNSGHKRGGKVLRLVGNNHEPHAFSTWGAKALCGIGSIAATLESRSIRLELRRKLLDEKTENLRHADPKETAQLASKLARFAQDNQQQVSKTHPEPISVLTNRDQDNWEPLLAVAHTAGGIWPNEVKKAAVAISGPTDSDQADIKTELLRDIRQVFGDYETEKIFSTDLIDKLCTIEQSPWCAWNTGKPISTRQLSRRLEDFGIRPADIRIGQQVRKGYKLEKFQDAFSRYLKNRP